nr:MAG TPA: hypothetical protein [Caudoviricetes sp.]
MLHSAWNGNGIVTIDSEMLRQCLETKRLDRQRRCADLTGSAKAWRSKAQTSNGIAWNRYERHSKGYGCKA